MQLHVLGTCKTLQSVLVALHRDHLKRFLNQVELRRFEKLLPFGGSYPKDSIFESVPGS